MTSSQYNADYLLDSDQETLRLERQARIYGVEDDLRIMALSGDEQVLDAGCGSGSITRTIARSLGRGTATGLDRQAKYVEFARRKAAAEGIANIRFETETRQSCSFPTRASMSYGRSICSSGCQTGNRRSGNSFGSLAQAAGSSPRTSISSRYVTTRRMTSCRPMPSAGSRRRATSWDSIISWEGSCHICSRRQGSRTSPSRLPRIDALADSAVTPRNAGTGRRNSRASWDSAPRYSGRWSGPKRSRKGSWTSSVDLTSTCSVRCSTCRAGCRRSAQCLDEDGPGEVCDLVQKKWEFLR
jgi:hypothetical protein